jgi:transposase
MIQITPQMRILVAVAAVDFRKGIDGLARLCREELGSDPFCGALFVFRNRRATAIKILVYDGDGFWICQKRLSRGHFSWWPDGAQRLRALEARQLQALVWNGDPARMAHAPLWRSVRPADLRPPEGFGPQAG